MLEGWSVNRNKLQRLWRRRKRLGTTTTEYPAQADAPNRFWMVDF